MPDRIVRDELLDSDRYWSLPSDTHRMLFDHFLLTADDLGNAEATTGVMRRRLLQRNISDADAQQLIADLNASDILRSYERGGKRYVHIPRFRQRLRSYRRVNPRPPKEIEDNEINELMSNLSDKRQSNVGQMPDTCQTPDAEGRKEVEGRKYDISNNKQTPNITRDRPKSKPPEGYFENLKPKPNGTGSSPAWWTDDRATDAKGAELGIAGRPGELYPEYRSRLFAEIARRKRATP